MEMEVQGAEAGWVEAGEEMEVDGVEAEAEAEADVEMGEAGDGDIPVVYAGRRYIIFILNTNWYWSVKVHC
jgi:hypothetical protein